jgi:hypothetical protein
MLEMTLNRYFGGQTHHEHVSGGVPSGPLAVLVNELCVIVLNVVH